MAAFENPKSGSILYIILWMFELIFAISFVLKFLVDYREPGNPVPVKDLAKIA